MSVFKDFEVPYPVFPNSHGISSLKLWSWLCNCFLFMTHTMSKEVAMLTFSTHPDTQSANLTLINTRAPIFVYLTQETSPSEEPAKFLTRDLTLGLAPASSSAWIMSRRQMWQAVPSGDDSFWDHIQHSKKRNHTMSNVKTAQKDLQSQFTCNTVHNNNKMNF